MEGSSLHQVQKAVPEEIYAGGSKTRTFREATQQDADLIIGIKTRYNAGKTRKSIICTDMLIHLSEQFWWRL